jgi:hypothetical protein
MVRTDGRKIVAVATLATVSVVCFAQIYLPFWADRDKIRGMAEEEDMPAAAKREIRLMEQQEHRRQQQQPQQMSKSRRQEQRCCSTVRLRREHVEEYEEIMEQFPNIFE